MALVNSVINKAVVKEKFEIELINETKHIFNMCDVLDLVNISKEEGVAIVRLPQYPLITLSLPQENFALCSDRTFDSVFKRVEKLKDKQEKDEKKQNEKEAKIKEKELNKGNRNYIKNKKLYNMDVSEFADKLIWLMDKEGITKEDIQNKLKIDFIKQGLWLNGKSFPSIETRKELSLLFGVSEAFLCESSEEKRKVRITRSIRGTSDWYFRHIGKEFDFVSKNVDGVVVKVSEGQELQVKKGDFIVIFTD